MQAAIDRVMETYSLLVSLTPQAEAQVRERVAAHLAGMQGDENVLAVAGLQFLRATKPASRRRRAPPA